MSISAIFKKFITRKKPSPRSGFQNIDFQRIDLDLFNDIEKYANQLFSEMSVSERQFLHGLVRHYKPEKILEVGVSAGGSSAVMLNALRDRPASKLYAFDVSDTWYQDQSKKTGHAVFDLLPEQASSQYTLLLGSHIVEKLDEVGGNIDLCLLDAFHDTPGELLDYMTVLPYMRPGGIIVIHDINLHAHQWAPLIPKGLAMEQVWNDRYHRSAPLTCGLLFASASGEKRLSPGAGCRFMPNMGAIQFNERSRKDILSVALCLLFPWSYLPPNSALQKLETFFAEQYSSDIADIYKKAVAYGKFTAGYANAYKHRRSLEAAGENRNRNRLKEQHAKVMRHYKNAPEAIKTMPALLGDQCRAIYYYLASQVRFAGEIVDAGCFIGGTTVSLAEGLKANPLYEANKEKKILVYDLFEMREGDFYHNWLTSQGLYQDDGRRPEIMNFRALFDRFTANYQEMTTVFAGDITETGRENQRPIELLGIDCCKTAGIMDHMLRRFFTRLIPGASTVIHQDYIFDGCPWIPISMGKLEDFFEPVFTCFHRAGYSAAWRCVWRITVEEISRLFGEGTDWYFDHESNAGLMLKIQKNMPTRHGQSQMGYALANYYDSINMKKEAIHQLKMTKTLYPDCGMGALARKLLKSAS